VADRGDRGLRAVVVDRGWLSGEEFDELVAPEAVIRLGFPPPRRHP